MFEMKKMGLKLVKLRKQFDLTQVEVADHLGVSYQAVSNWERGESMPDISKLPEIAELYKTSLDELFGNKKFSKVIEASQKDELEKLVKEEPLTIKEVEEISAIVKPSQLEELAESATVEEVEPDMLGLLPFTSKKKANGIVLKLLEEMDAYELMMHACAFVSKETMGEIYTKAKTTHKQIEFLDFAPFFKQSVIDKITYDVLKEETDLYELLERVAPFVSKDVMDHIMKDAIGTIEGERLIEFAPFISREVMDSIVEEMLANNKGFDNVIDHIVPFISKEVMGKIVLRDLEQGKSMKKYIQLAPFIEQDILDKVIDLI